MDNQLTEFPDELEEETEVLLSMTTLSSLLTAPSSTQ